MRESDTGRSMSRVNQGKGHRQMHSTTDSPHPARDSSQAPVSTCSIAWDDFVLVSAPRRGHRKSQAQERSA
jgi:hypothetical protein